MWLCIIFCWILLWVLLQPPTTRLAAPLYQNKHFVSKIYTQSHFVHMLHNTPDSSNFEVIIMFPGRLDIYSLVIEVYLHYQVKSLRSLTYLVKFLTLEEQFCITLLIKLCITLCKYVVTLVWMKSIRLEKLWLKKNKCASYVMYVYTFIMPNFHW